MPYALKPPARLQAVAGGNLVIADISFWQKITVSLQKLEEFGHVSGEEVNGGSFPEQIRSPQPDKVPEIKRVKAYLITGAALLALGAAGCIALCCTHYYVFGALVFLVGMAVAPVFFRHNCKVYEVDGHTVVLFTGPVKKIYQRGRRDPRQLFYQHVARGGLACAGGRKKPDRHFPRV